MKAVRLVDRQRIDAHPFHQIIERQINFIGLGLQTFPNGRRESNSDRHENTSLIVKNQ